MRVVFCIYEWSESKLPLQPWLTIKKVSEGLAGKGHEVHIVTDVPEPVLLTGLQTHTVTSLRGPNKRQIHSLLKALQPDALVMLPTPLNIVTASWLDGLPGCRRIGFASYPFYNWSELLRAMRILKWKDVAQYLRHLLVLPFVMRLKMRHRLDVLIAQSSTTATRLSGTVVPGCSCHFIPPGIDLHDWLPGDNESVDSSGDDVVLLYLGAATAIRGFDVTLDAMQKVTNKNVRLHVLARGADTDAVDGIRALIARRNLTERVEVQGGWIDRGRLVNIIQGADAVLQPFVLVPSELPVTAMEVIACGTPVIGSAIDGMPSTIGSAGTVVPQGCADDLARTIDQFAEDENIRTEWSRGCIKQRNSMLQWEQVVGCWESVLRG